jgi:ATP-binding cassette subfamily B protein
MGPTQVGAIDIHKELSTTFRTVRHVWALVAKRDKIVLSLAAVIMAIVSASTAAYKILLGRLVDTVPAMKEDSGAHVFAGIVGIYLVAIAALYLLAEALRVVRNYVVRETTTRMERDRIVQLVGHLLKMDFHTLGREHIGALPARIARGIDGFVTLLRLGFQQTLPAISMAALALGVVFVGNWKVGLVMLGVVPAGWFLAVWQLRWQRKVRLELFKTYESLDATVVQQLDGIEYVRAANTHARETERVFHLAEERRERELRLSNAINLFDCAKALNAGIFLILVIAFSIYLANRGEISYGKIMEFSLQFLAVAWAIHELHGLLEDASDASLRVADLLSLVKTPLDASFGMVTLREPAAEPGVPFVIAKNLRVEYRTPDGALRTGLDGINMTIRWGETIGVAGRTGSGKSTWLRVLMRLTEPSGGLAVVGGVSLGTLSRESIAKLIGYVGQNPFIFAGTVQDNITYGIDSATPEAIRLAATRACIHDEVMKMPGDYQAILTDRGSNLSGGQRQRIALARVFLKNPPLLILDEATSALDNISERSVQRAITEARTDRTVILVAHRLSTLRDADRIFVFHDGKIVEEGCYTDLVAKEGFFHTLVRSAEI